MYIMDEWKIIDTYFKSNRHILVDHHIKSYDTFITSGIPQIFKEFNPIRLKYTQLINNVKQIVECNLYFGRKSGKSIYYGKPVVYSDTTKNHYMYPNEARLRNMTYAFSIHYDLEIEYKIEDQFNNVEVSSVFLEKLYLCRMPIMLHSNACILSCQTDDMCYYMGECKNDIGGYFIIDGKEKVIVSQEKFANNMIYITDNRKEDMSTIEYMVSAKITSASDDASKPRRQTALHIVAPSGGMSNLQIVVNIPNVKKAIPLFIVMRALGVISDKNIIEHCLLGLSDKELFIPSIHDANVIFTQSEALSYIKTFTKYKTDSYVMYILSDMFLPHVGELDLKNKALFLGYMVKRMLDVYTKISNPTDRDSFIYKRIETSGSMMYDLFKDYYKIMQGNIRRRLDEGYYYAEKNNVNRVESEKILQGNNFANLLTTLNYHDFFGKTSRETEATLDAELKRTFKGDWGASQGSKKDGIVQDLDRLSFNAAISHRRKINLPMDASLKIVKPRLLHGSHWGKIDPVDTPDGGNIGFHKHLAIMAKITNGSSGTGITNWVITKKWVKELSTCSFSYCANSTKVFINGKWIGMASNPVEMTDEIIKFKRNGLLPTYMSVSFNIRENEITIFTDEGRLLRPVFYMKDNIPSLYHNDNLTKLSENPIKSWIQLLQGFNNPLEKLVLNPEASNVYNTAKELYGKNIDLDKNACVVEYIDTMEENNCMIKLLSDINNSKYKYCEIHPSLMFGVMGNQIVFPQHNQLPRDLFSCAQSKQAVSLYHSNFNSRVDKMAVVLNNGQVPIVKSRFMKYISNEEHPYGVNTIVAIMCYNGYNVEDSILFNKASVDRGMFGTTYYNMYETHEESTTNQDTMVDSQFSDLDSDPNIKGVKDGYSAQHLDEFGLIRENTPITDKMIMIGKVKMDGDTKIDDSVYPKKGQTGYVDKAFMSEGEEGFRLAKIRIRDSRVPAVGDKFCSRCGQKGTIGTLIEEEDMPFTQDGTRPDIIINPHAFPSRMTIGQLVETIAGKSSLLYGLYADCTAFENNGIDFYKTLLRKAKYSDTGDELLYDGATGKQIEANVFMGPNYYMRLKHMVKDKINYRNKGPRTLLTRQTVQGRANDGGLRIGEMERDALIAHGVSGFIRSSMMDRGDKYTVAICNHSGTIAIYNENRDVLMSPSVDGPLNYSLSNDNEFNLNVISKFATEFSLINVPYAFKLLMHELATMNVQMRIITADNIEQLTTSNNKQLKVNFFKFKVISKVSYPITIKNKIVGGNKIAHNDTDNSTQDMDDIEIVLDDLDEHLDTEDIEDTEDTEDIEDTEDTEDIEDTEDTKDTENEYLLENLNNTGQLVDPTELNNHQRIANQQFYYTNDIFNYSGDKNKPERPWVLTKILNDNKVTLQTYDIESLPANAYIESVNLRATIEVSISMITPYKHIASVPLTQYPVTPVPFTPDPFTPVPFTPASVTPVPFTPVPFTPVPFTPAPFTPLPFTVPINEPDEPDEPNVKRIIIS
jgi:DNA-directed RNA polymerase II subunit RPB2